MRRRLLVAGLVVLTLAGSDLFACGEKFLVVSRGTRFQRAGIARPPATILVYANPASTLPKSLEKAEVDETLRKAGYKPTSISDPKLLEQTLRKGDWDLVITDLADGTTVRSVITGAAKEPMILPVVYRATGHEIAQAKKDYPRVIKGPVKSQAFLEAVDEAVLLRMKLLQPKSAD